MLGEPVLGYLDVRCRAAWFWEPVICLFHSHPGGYEEVSAEAGGTGLVQVCSVCDTGARY